MKIIKIKMILKHLQNKGYIKEEYIERKKIKQVKKIINK